MRKGLAVKRFSAAFLVVFLVLVLCAGIMPAPAQADDGNAPLNSEYVTKVVDKDGRELYQMITPVKPPEIKVPAVDLPQNSVTGALSLSDVPAFDWSYGCSATSAAMMFGYYDRTGYANFYTGPTNSGVCPMDNSVWGHTIYPNVTCGECPISATHNGLDGRATRGHVDDYWIDYGNAGPDPYVANGWAEHSPFDSAGDFMGTNQAKYNLTDGSTRFSWYTSGAPLSDYTGGEPGSRDGCHGMRLFAESRGYTILANYTQLIQGKGSNPALGFTFANYCSEIDAGRPVLIQVDGHTMLGDGYNTSGNLVYLHDTWDYSDHQMAWGGSYSGMAHYAVTVLQLAPASEASITVNSPNGGESWASGSSQTIAWTSASLTGNVAITLSRNGGSTYPETLAAAVPVSASSYLWTVTTPTSSACRVKITSLDTPAFFDSSDSNFTISAPTGIATWVNLLTSSATSPSARAAQSMSYDEGNNRVILFGGTWGKNDTWSYNPTANSWNQIQTATKPSLRYNSAMAYDPVRQQMILFGGPHTPTDTWRFNCVTNNWQQMLTVTSPSSREAPAMVYDPPSGKMILFGGRVDVGGGWVPQNDTWSFDPQTNQWAKLNPSGLLPPPRNSHAMVYDPQLHRVLMFGGETTYTSAGQLNDLWAYDAQQNQWMQLHPGGAIPSPRNSFAMSYDAIHQRMVIFGGDNRGLTSLGDTWAYDSIGNQWMQVLTSTSPAPRQSTMVFAQSIGRSILFGGWPASGTFLGDTWSLDLGVALSSLSLDPPAQDVGSPQGDVVVTLKVGNTQSINSIFAALTWDPAKLSLKTSVGNQGVELGSLFSSGMSMPVPSSGRLDLTVGLTGGTVNGPGEVAKIHFTVASGLPPGAAIPISFASSPLATITLGNGTTLNPTTTGCSLKVLSGEKVWPGDANNDGAVNGLDFTKIFLYWGKTGQGRTNASNQWKEEICPNATPAWSPKEALWADCNGDGAVNGLDFAVIFLNWGKTHS